MTGQIKFLALLSILLIACQLQAQRHVDLPVISVASDLDDTDIKTMTMDQIDVPALLAEDEASDFPDGKMRFALPIKTEIDLLSEGTKTEVEGGTVYRLHIDCPSAANINFLYSRFYIAGDGHLHIYNSSKTEIIGAFTSLNNTANQKYATAVINDERATLEYFEPSEAKGQSRIVISQVGYGYRSFAVNRASRGPGDSGACQVDINCPEGNDWQDEKKGVGRITQNGSDWCTGCMVQTVEADCSPLFLTADHCLPAGADAISSPDLSGFVIYFNYEYAGCGTGAVNLSETVSGATILANDSPSDFAILELGEDPLAAGYDIYFAGWDARDQTPVSGGVGIHHPSGDAKKIATHTVVPTSTGWAGSNDDSHWEVFWDATTNGHSVTEGGSSGSPIFDSNSRILGQLHGGSSINCTDPAADPGIYGKVSYSWQNNGATDNRRKLQPWLDPMNTGTLILDGAYPAGCSNNKIQFSQISSGYTEGSSCDSIEVTLDVTINTAPLATSTVDIVVSGTATAAEDYNVSPSTITFATGSSASQSVTVTIYADGLIELDEAVILSIENLNSSDTTVVIGNNSLHTLNIINDDIAPSSSASGDFVIGAGAETTTGIYSPFRGYWEDARFQIIYRASDLIAAGMQAGEISALSFDVSDKSSTQPYSGFTVGLKHTTSTAHTSDAFESGFTQVYTGSVTTALGWNTITFNTPFLWDGISNLMLETCFDNDSWTANDIIRYDDMGYDVENTNRTDGSTGCTLGGNFTYTFRPQIRFTLAAGSNIQTDVNSAAGYAELPIGPFETVHFYDAISNKIMAKVENLSAHDFGCTRVEVDRAGVDDTAWFGGNQVTNKTFLIDPENPDASSSVLVTLYYDSTELINFLPSITAMSRADVAISDPGNDMSNTDHEATSLTPFGSHYEYSSTFTSGLGGFALSDVASGGCPDTLDLTGMINTNQIYQASNVIRTNGLTVIQAGTTVFFDAGNFIELKEEFEVELGAELTVRIQVCN